MRRIVVDVAPLRESHDFRLLFGGQLVSVLGTQLTAVAVMFQVYRLTHSSLDVGLVSLAQLLPLLVLSLLGGPVIDARDRRRLLMAVEAVMAVSSAGLALNADLGPHLWPIFVFPAVTAGLTGIDTPTRNSLVPRLVRPGQITSANALFQALIQTGAVVGPAAAGLLLAGAGLDAVYWIDVASFGVSILAASRMAGQAVEGEPVTPGLHATIEGFRFVRRHRALQGSFLIDVDAMVFGMPRALFPALAATTFGGGAAVLGLLYAAPGMGALIGVATTGWAGSVRRQGRAVLVAVAVWGVAIAGFGLVSSLPVALVLLAVAGWADMISALFRNTILQVVVPDRLRGRLLAVKVAVVQGGPRLGDLEAGAVASAFSSEVSVVSGGLLCIAGVVLLALRRPEFRRVVIDPGTTAAAGTPDGPTTGAGRE